MECMTVSSIHVELHSHGANLRSRISLIGSGGWVSIHTLLIHLLVSPTLPRRKTWGSSHSPPGKCCFPDSIFQRGLWSSNSNQGWLPLLLVVNYQLTITSCWSDGDTVSTHNIHCLYNKPEQHNTLIQKEPLISRWLIELLKPSRKAKLLMNSYPYTNEGLISGTLLFVLCLYSA